MFVNFFIKRPIFATVCSLIIVLAGVVSIPTLPITQYPNVVPPQVLVTATYTGASAEVVESAVTIPLEQQINGVEGMKYMSSTSSNDGTSSINITFDLERDVDLAAMDVQNRVNAARGQLPAEVKATGVTITKTSSAIIMAFGVYSDGGEYDNLFISNYINRYVKDTLKRVEGVGRIIIDGERKYAMRLWLDPNRLAARGLTASDVVNALRQQNVQVAAGQIGQPPFSGEQDYQMNVRVLGRLKDASQFENIVLKTGSDGSLVLLKDVGRAEVGAQDYSTFMRFSGKNAVGIQIFQQPKANALEVDRRVRAELARLAERFPPGLKYQIDFDPTVIIGESIKKVVVTLFKAIVLVILVIFVFLQDWRSTIIPTITIPVSLVGTFAFIKVMGFSTNTLTLFGLTLATGLVVDDAIVVIENIARLIQNQGIRPREAAFAAMGQMTGAVIATSLVLIALFVPVAFFPGTTGQLYKQFSLTIAFSVGLSTFNALTLTPALSAILLRREGESRGWFFDNVNRLIDFLRRGYQRSLRHLLNFKGIVLLLYVLSLGLTCWLFLKVPTGFVPIEDKGYFGVSVQGVEGVSLDYTNKVMTEVERELLKLPGVASTYAIGGFSFTGNAPNKAIIFATLEPLPERTELGLSTEAIIDKAEGPLSQITGAKIVPFRPPAIRGLGNVGGVQFELQDQSGSADWKTIAQIKDTLVRRGNAQPQLRDLLSTFTASNPQLLTQVHRKQAKALNVSLEDIFNTLEVFMGSKYVNDFEFLNRIYRVYVRADEQFRSNPKDIGQFYVRSGAGQMISLSNLVEVTSTTAPQIITHYNLFRSAEISGSAAPGYSSGQAIEAMQNLAREVLPPGMSYEWSGLALEQIESGSQAVFIFALGVVFVFLVLAAQYENYTDPLIIILSVPPAILGALLAQSLRGLENDVFCQIGLVMLIGLASKNAILIVEFANQLREQGLPITKAVTEAAQTRLRPILMTSLTFMFGILPLVIAEGAGAASRQSLGTAVFGGMIVSTLLSLYLVPVLYIVVGKLRTSLK